MSLSHLFFSSFSLCILSPSLLLSFCLSLIFTVCVCVVLSVREAAAAAGESSPQRDCGWGGEGYGFTPITDLLPACLPACAHVSLFWFQPSVMYNGRDYVRFFRAVVLVLVFLWSWFCLPCSDVVWFCSSVLSLLVLLSLAPSFWFLVFWSGSA